MSSSVTAPAALTFTALATLEPRLLELERIAKAAAANPPRHYCRQMHYLIDLHDALDTLTGKIRTIDGNPVLKTPQAREVAMNHLVGLLPPCTDCRCSWSMTQPAA